MHSAKTASQLTCGHGPDNALQSRRQFADHSLSRAVIGHYHIGVRGELLIKRRSACGKALTVYLPGKLLQISDSRWSVAALIVRSFQRERAVDVSMANYMDASRMARFSWRDGRQIRLQVYIRPVDAGQSLRALMDFADPRLILLESSKLDSPYRLGGSRSDLFAITRC